ncbi:DUF397 domain-containing protein [Streptomyces sp. ISL-100]|uniref:DUF397 domain-containing protein n=1 Tax=Streptomyces sp. ISL-100 TaxID=2819173 RepID=UPI001BE7DFBB|nr:DUF397 domain-containing protein [Streptomyces sp. ISL-100]MBT2397701.1 DUF397 domain-containing protein [Streptomyces sp. ISL-100]
MNSSDHTVSWRKSSYSGASEGNCLEVADGLVGIMPVRDSKIPSGPALAFGATAWSSFVSAVKDDRLPRT